MVEESYHPLMARWGEMKTEAFHKLDREKTESASVSLFIHPKFCLKTQWGLSHSFVPAVRSGGLGRRRQSHHNELLWAVVWPYGLLASSPSHPPPPPSTVHHTPLTPQRACGGAQRSFGRLLTGGLVPGLRSSETGMWGDCISGGECSMERLNGSGSL